MAPVIPIPLASLCPSPVPPNCAQLGFRQRSTCPLHPWGSCATNSSDGSPGPTAGPGVTTHSSTLGAAQLGDRRTDGRNGWHCRGSHPTALSPHPPSWCPPVGCRQGTDSLNLTKCLRKGNVESSEGDKGQRLQPAASPEQGDGWGRGVPAGVTPTRVALGHMAHRHEWHSDMWHRGTDGAWT